MVAQSPPLGAVRALAFDEKTVDGALFRLSWPVLLERLSLTIQSAVGAILVGRFVGAAGVAAIGIAGLVSWLPNAGGFGLTVGTTAVVARDYGARNTQGIRRSTNAGIIAGLVWGLGLAVLMWLVAPVAMELMALEGEGAHMGVQYLQLTMLGLPFGMVTFALNGSLRGSGDTRTPMLVVLVNNLANAAITFSLVSGIGGLPQLGIAAPGIGVAAAGPVGLVLAGYAIRRRGLLRDRPPGQPVCGIADITRLLNLSVPVGLEELQFSLAFLLYSRIISGMGLAATAAHTVALRAQEISLMPGFALGTATTALAGQALGARLPDLATIIAKTARRWAVLVMLGLAVVVAVCAPWVVRVFVDDPEVVDIGSGLLRAFVLAYPLLGLAATMTGALRAAGDVRFVLGVVTASAWLLRIPLAALFGLGLGLGAPGAWLGAVLEILVRTAVLWWRFARTRWQEREV